MRRVGEAGDQAARLAVPRARVGARPAAPRSLGYARLAADQHLNLGYRLPLRDSLFPVLEVAALRGPTIVELAIGTPRPYDRSPLMDIIQKVLDGGYDAFDDDEFESSA